MYTEHGRETTMHTFSINKTLLLLTQACSRFHLLYHNEALV